MTDPQPNPPFPAPSSVSRRNLLRASLGGVLGLAGTSLLASCAAATTTGPAGNTAMPGMVMPAMVAHPLTAQLGNGGHMGITGNMLQGDVDPAAVNGFDPMAMLTDFDYGKVSTLPSGQILREYTLYAADKLIEIAPGLTFPAWTYNGRVPDLHTFLT